MTNARRQAVGAAIERMRLARGLTRIQLADRCDLHAASLRTVERGENDPLISTVTRIALGLDVSVALFARAYHLGTIDRLDPWLSGPRRIPERPLHPERAAGRLAQFVIRVRRERRLSRQQAAMLIGMHHNQLYRIETAPGDRQLGTLDRLAQAMCPDTPVVCLVALCGVYAGERDPATTPVPGVRRNRT